MLLAAVRTSTRPFLRRALVAKSCFTADAFQSKFVRQGGILNCDLSDLPHCTVNITSKWQDHCEISSSEEVDVEIKITEFEESNQITIKGCSSAENASCTIDITIPEYMDINLDANHLNLTIVNKVQGDVAISCQSGNIVADKLRGELITFSCGEADLTIKKLLEGCSVVHCRTLNAQMINGDVSEICASVVSINALYCAQARIDAADNINVGLSRGSIEAVSLAGNVSVSGIDGSFDLVAEHGSIKLQVNKLLPFPGTIGAAEASYGGGDVKSAPLSQVVHEVDAQSKRSVPGGKGDALAGPDLHATVEAGLEHRRSQKHECVPDAAADDSGAVKFGVEHTVDIAAPRRCGSRAWAPKGHITAVVDPELEATLHCLSNSGGLQRMTVTLNSDGFELAPAAVGHSPATPEVEETEASAGKPSNVGTGAIDGVGKSTLYRPEDVRTPRPGTWQGTCIKGRLTGKSTGTKRPTFSNNNASSGKINLSGAEAQALESGGVSLQDASGRSGSDGSGSKKQVGAAAEEADMTLVARGNVRVETMSWIQIIRSKYGFEDKPDVSNGDTQPRGGVGRTASASTLAAEIAQLALKDSQK